MVSSGQSCLCLSRQLPALRRLYVETIDVGEEEPRTIASGLRDFVAKDSLKASMAGMDSAYESAEFNWYSLHRVLIAKATRCDDAISASTTALMLMWLMQAIWHLGQLAACQLGSSSAALANQEQTVQQPRDCRTLNAAH